MLISMTGFSSATLSLPRTAGEALEVTLMLKSLNARFFEVNCRLPASLQPLETDIIKRLKTKLMRGTVFVTIQVLNPHTLKGQLSPAYALIENYVTALKDIQQKFSIPGTITISDIMTLPNFFEFPDMLADQETCSVLLKALDNVADELTKARKKEGSELEHDILERSKRLRSFFVSAQKLALEVAEQRKKTQLDQFETTLTAAPSEMRDSQLQLLHMQINRYDVNEELVRFATHLDTLEHIVKSDEPEKGKKLEFTTQELLREINTLGSKANNAELGNLTILCKVELEKIREQVQNVL